MAAMIFKVPLQRDREPRRGRDPGLHANPTRERFAFKRDRLPNPAEYFCEQGLKLTGSGEWKSALCPFHNDTRPSLRVRLDTGAFRCMTCGAKGGDVLAFHMFARTCSLG
jgi:CHC2-type zinc finger protein